MTPAARTVIFVDIDGVVNVGIRDGRRAPLLLNKDNCALAQMCKDCPFDDPTDAARAARLAAALARRPSGGGARSYQQLACDEKRQYSAVLVRRLAAIIQACEAEAEGPGGSRARVVLASNWRRPCFARQLGELEREVSAHLGRLFAFDASTDPLVCEGLPGERLGCIGDYLERFCADCGEEYASVRALVLDDFFASPPGGWAARGARIDSVSDAEAYLQSRGAARGVAHVEAKVVHCFEEWETPEGLLVQVGTGLTFADTLAAQAFVAGRASESLPEAPDFDEASPKLQKLVMAGSMKELHPALDAALIIICAAGLLAVAWTSMVDRA